jgi:hypothetical protein
MPNDEDRIGHIERTCDLVEEPLGVIGALSDPLGSVRMLVDVVLGSLTKWPVELATIRRTHACHSENRWAAVECRITHRAPGTHDGIMTRAAALQVAPCALEIDFEGGSRS